MEQATGMTGTIKDVFREMAKECFPGFVLGIS